MKSSSRYLKSIRDNWKGIVLMSFAALMVAVGQLLWKRSAGTDSFLLVVGFVLYGVGALLMVLAFKYGKLSVVHPVLSFSYVFGIFFGYFFLGEILRPLQLVAIAMIMTGVAFIGGGDK